MELLSPAKINLFLQVTGRRPDGYHELLMLMCRVSLYDKISMTLGGDKIRVSCTDPDIPGDETNLAHRAASLFFKALDRQAPNRQDGLEIFIDKNIPAGAGLGGGSSNAATILSGLNRHFAEPFSRSELMDMGLSLGADVPFFIFEHPAVASGIGENLKIYDKLKPLKVLIIYPGFGVSTAEIYKKLNLRLTKCKKKLKNTFFKKEGFDVRLHLCNDLEYVTMTEYPDIGQMKIMLTECGAEGSLMSGSGSAVFGLFSHSDKAEIARQNLSLQNKSWKIFLTEMLL